MSDNFILSTHCDDENTSIVSADDVGVECQSSLDTVSSCDTTTQDETDHQQLLQTTQSLLMASSMLGTAATTPVNSLYHFSSDSIKEANAVNISVDELIQENRKLREKLKEVTNDRDRLLCEVSNLRLELDMSELKKLPEECFPPKEIERSNSAQYGIAGQPASASSGSALSTECGGYVYLQQHYLPSAVSSSNTSAATSNYPVGGSQTHMVYQHHPQQLQFPTCHQQQLIQQSGNIAQGGVHYSGQYVNPQHQHHHNYHHMLHAHHHPHHGGAVVIAGSSIGTGMGGGVTSPTAMQQNLHKKNSIRANGEVLKRARGQTAYELSQDLLDKQIELLERKYGGVCARNAAITIQRAFRHYMMVKKFASITAMAKAEKRLSRRPLMQNASGEDGPVSNSSFSSAYGSGTESQLEAAQAAQSQHQQQQQQPRVTIMAGPSGGVTVSGAAASPTSTSRTPPTRSLSMRERRQLDGSPIPRSQSGASAASSVSSSLTSSSTLGSTHPHVNLLHAAEPHYYHYANYHAGSHDLSLASSSNSTNLDTSLNGSWVSACGTSPHTPYYSAAQIYMRPKNIMTSAERKKVPPEVPKRTSSITAQQHAQHIAAQQQHQQMLLMRQTPPPPSMLRSNGLCKSAENGSLTSVQSSGSDSSVTSAERVANSDLGSDRSNSPNMTWKRGTNLNSSQQYAQVPADLVYTQSAAAPMMVAVSGGGTVGTPLPDDHAVSSHTSAAQFEQHEQQDHHLNAASTTSNNYKISETIRKRQYRVGLNLFNKKPEKGITYLIRRGFLENTPQGVARFLISRKGLSRQMIGEYLGNLQNQFNMAVLNCFALELDLSGTQVDVALRKFQAYFRMPGEAQKIERLMEVFSQRYCQCNQDIVGRLRSSDTIFVLAFAIIMLNTDLHTPNLKPERRMRVEDFIKNLRGIDDCHDIDKDMLGGIYDRVKANEFKPASDHVTQVMKVQATIVGKKTESSIATSPSSLLLSSVRDT